MAVCDPRFCVSVDAQGQITLESGENVKVSEDVVEQAVEQVLASGAQRGKLSDLGLRFLVETNKDGETQIAFSDLSWERASLWRLVLNSLLIGAGALVVFLSSVCSSPDWPSSLWKRPGPSSGSL